MGATAWSPRPSKATRKVPLWRKALPWLIGLAAICVLVAFVAVVFGNRNPLPEHFSNQPVDVVKPEKSITVPDDAKLVAKTFIQTAVARKNLEKAYPLAGPAIKQGMTMKEWKSGNIAVIPFPLDDLYVAPFKVDYAHERDILMEVALLADPKTGVKSQIFFINLKKYGTGDKARWLVDNWVPRGSAAVPDGTFRGGG